MDVLDAVHALPGRVHGDELGRPARDNGRGGVELGPGGFPAALRCVYVLRGAVELCRRGCGGHLLPEGVYRVFRQEGCGGLPGLVEFATVFCLYISIRTRWRVVLMNLWALARKRYVDGVLRHFPVLGKSATGKKKTVVGVVAIFLPEGDLFFWFLSKLVFFGVVDFVYDERIRVSNLHRAIK